VKKTQGEGDSPRIFPIFGGQVSRLVHKPLEFGFSLIQVHSPERRKLLHSPQPGIHPAFMPKNSSGHQEYKSERHFFGAFFKKKYKTKRTPPKVINLKAYGSHKKLSAFISELKGHSLALI
jgi:hypothetical protein